MSRETCPECNAPIQAGGWAEHLVAHMDLARARADETAALLEAFVGWWEKATEENSRAVAKAVGHAAYNALWDLMPKARARLAGELAAEVSP